MAFFSEVVTIVFGLMLYLIVWGYFPLQIALAIIFRGRWRLAALAPLVIMLPVTASAIAGLWADANL